MISTHKKFIASLTVAAAIASAAAITPAFAQTTNVSVNASVGGGIPGMTVGAQGSYQGRGPGMGGTGGMGKGMGMMHPGVFGSVTAVSGTTLTVASRGFGASAATTTYTVDASSATVVKNNATSSLASVAVGDRIFAAGTVSGTNLTATSIRDGMMMGGRKPGMSGNGQPMTPPIKGNGQPVVAGTVSSVNGTTLAITTSSNTSYSIDASSATVSKSGAASTVSAVAVGDYVVVQGSVNGTSVTAASIIDQQARPASSPGSPSGAQSGPHSGGFFGSIGQFFKNLFGF